MIRVRVSYGINPGARYQPWCEGCREEFHGGGGRVGLRPGLLGEGNWLATGSLVTRPVSSSTLTRPGRSGRVGCGGRAVERAQTSLRQAYRRACCTAANCSWQAGSLCDMSFTCRVGVVWSGLVRLLVGYRRGSCCVRGPQADCARRSMRAHGHGRVEQLVVHLGVDSLHWSLVARPLDGVQVGG